MKYRCIFTKTETGRIKATIQHYCAGYYDRFSGYGYTKEEAYQDLILQIKVTIQMAQDDLECVLTESWIDETDNSSEESY